MPEGSSYSGELVSLAAPLAPSPSAILLCSVVYVRCAVCVRVFRSLERNNARTPALTTRVEGARPQTDGRAGGRGVDRPNERTKAPALGWRSAAYYHVPRVGSPLLESDEPAAGAAGGKNRAAGAILELDFLDVFRPEPTGARKPHSASEVGFLVFRGSLPVLMKHMCFSPGTIIVAFKTAKFCEG